MKNMKHRIGEENMNYQNIKMKIIEYIDSKHMTIEFDDGYITKNKSYINFKNGNIPSHNFPIVFDKGYVENGIYNSYKNEKIYGKWLGMFYRCYDKECREKQPTYKDCTVDKEWHNFQNFAKWYEENLWSEDCTCLDKDILIKGNKIYSPNNCILVDIKINSLFTKQDKKRGNLPIGVHIPNYSRKRIKNINYQAQCSHVILNHIYTRNDDYLGLYNTPEKAFEVYKKEKEKYIKEVADYYKTKYSNFPSKLYNAMYRYEVEITD